MARTFRRIETKLIHAGEPEPRLAGAVVTPIFQTAMFETAGESSYHEVRYIRLNNSPNHLVLHRKLAALENAEAALVAGSGMAAISTALLALLEAGDHLLAQDCLYGGTHDLLTHDLPKLGLSCDFVNNDDPDSWKRKLRPNTKAIYVESLSNPMLQVPDLEAVVAFAREHGLVSLIDNTFTSPINFRPIEHGFNVSLHSATKYLNGHSDIVAGACIGGAGVIEKITHKLNHLGGTLDPHAAFLLHRGIKTLALRVAHQNRSALEIARHLEAHPAIARVNYPGLESHPRHQRARELFDGFGGMMSFEVKGGTDAAEKFMRLTRIPTIAPSLGGVETLLTRPAATSHSGMSKGDREQVGVTDSLIRMSVGIEATEELIEDFDQALGSLHQTEKRA
jgi:cystathionine beta-lyase/cystathionine gamma-synthase